MELSRCVQCKKYLSSCTTIVFTHDYDPAVEDKLWLFEVTIAESSKWSTR